ncbi:MAG: Chromosome partition protein smc, partial [Parcubacteria group bacterium Gr01-1014_29]
MILKKLEIAGFKSFGKAVTLEFDAPVTAIVGPNGSGKSNVSEAIRWVLGEQSMKSLRGKRGEDFIFHGSGSASQLGKARVSIVFENKAHVFPLDFTEVTISREVYRDGANEYRLNDSQVRLKDIIELMSNVGVGGSAHHIISQGEADRLLWASPKERKNMLEDALGLRIYHIKQTEAERKLAATEENMHEVGMLRREIQPHMRYLREQAVKVEASVKLREELRNALQDYLSREETTLQKDREKTQKQVEPLAKSFELLKKTVEELRSSVATQQEDAARGMPGEWEKLIEHLSQLEEKRRSIERDIGRLEGRLSVLRQQKKDSSLAFTMPALRVRKEFQTILMLIEEAVSMETLEKIRSALQMVTTRVKRFLSGAGEDAVATSEQDYITLEREHHDLLQQLAEIEKEQQELLSLRDTMGVRQQASRDLLIQNQRDLRKKEEELYQVRDTMRSLEMDQEQIRMRQVEFRHECEEAMPYGVEAERKRADNANTWTTDERDKARHAIGRLKIKLEEAGGIDPQVVGEFEEVRARDMFLAKELEDLEKTKTALRELMKELEEKLAQSFSEGIKNITAE